MGQILVRGITDEAKERLRDRAKLNGRSLEAEVRAIIEAAAAKAEPALAASGLGLGAELLERQRHSGLTNEDWIEFDRGLQEARRNFKFRDITFD